VFNTKKCLIRATVILFLLTNVSCSAVAISNINIKIDEVGASYAILNWEAVPNMTGYEVYSTSSKAKEYTLMDSTTDLSYTDTTLIPLSVAYYKIRPYKETEGTKTYGSYSNSVVAETTALGTSELIMFGLTNDEVILTWLAVPGAGSYQVLVSNIGDKAMTIGCTTELLTCTLKIITSKTYFFRIVALYESEGELYTGHISPVLIVNANPIINPVVRLSALETSINGVWKIDGTDSGYEIYLGTSSVFAFSKKVLEVKTNSFTIKGLLSSQRYTVWIKAYVNTSTGRKYSEFAPVAVSVMTLAKNAASN
jgi:hypothetical protein